jgi:hypothetical protein
LTVCCSFSVTHACLQGSFFVNSHSGLKPRLTKQGTLK